MTTIGTPHRVEHLSVDDRARAGREARRRVRRSGLAEFHPAADRDPIALLESQAVTRVPELVPIRYGRMVPSAFTFYRGAALVMAADLASAPTTGLTVQACGDAHLTNFGGFASPERQLVFDINDFDETTPGPWEWDVKRLVASLEVAGRANGFADAERRSVLLTAGAAYRVAMRGFASMNTLDLWYSRLDETILAEASAAASKRTAKRAAKRAAKARTRDSLQAMSKMTEIVDGEPRIVSDAPLVVNIRDLVAETGVDQQEVMEIVQRVLRNYRQTLASDRRHLLEQYRFVDLARKVVGVGSVGTRCWIALFLGRDNNDPLFLQIKEAQPSVLEAYTAPSQYDSAGERVVSGQRLMQSVSDIFLGWDRAATINGEVHDYYVRQLRDWKISADVDVMDPSGMAAYAKMCAWTLAKAHARSGDAVAIASYLGKSGKADKAIAEFAQQYADQNERDHAALIAAIDSGRLTAIRGL